MSEPFDARGLCYPWKNADPAVDELCRSIHAAIKRGDKRKAGREEIFREIWDLADAGRWPWMRPWRRARRFRI